MAAFDKLRDRATWLFASALAAREGGISPAAQIDGITDLANQPLPKPKIWTEWRLNSAIKERMGCIQVERSAGVNERRWLAGYFE
jgi:hypothetical protein